MPAWRTVFISKDKRINTGKQLKKLLSDADADVREHGIGREEAIGMLGRLQTTLHKYDTSRRGPNIKHIVLWAGTNDVLNFMSSAEDIIQGLVTLIEACGSHRLVHVCTWQEVTE